MNQFLIDYTVRNITTGDEEELRLLELPDDTIAELPDDVRAILAPHRARYQADYSIDQQAFDTDQDKMLALLLPRIRQHELYDSDYEAWEVWLLESDDAPWNTE